MRIQFNPRVVVSIAIFVLLASYALYQARFLIIGPQVYINTPQDGQVVDSSIITIEGEARNIARMTMNDRQIFTDEAGHWSEKLIVSKGISIITLKAKDRFGREITKSIQVVLK